MHEYIQVKHIINNQHGGTYPLETFGEFGKDYHYLKTTYNIAQTHSSEHSDR